MREKLDVNASLCFYLYVNRMIKENLWNKPLSPKMQIAFNDIKDGIAVVAKRVIEKYKLNDEGERS